jgi:hypothetical protein
MARNKPPYWVRWAGEEATAICLNLRDELNDVILSMLRGQRLDETVQQLQRMVPEIERMKDEQLRPLKNGFDLNSLSQLWDWLRQDEIALEYISRRIEEA